MSTGIAGFQTGVMIAKQATSGTLATTGFMLLPAEDNDSLTHGQTYLDRKPTYGNRTQASSMHTRDYTMPGGDMPAWAIGIDGTSLALLAVCRLFFQNYSIANSATGIGSHAWTFTPRSTNPSTLASYELYSVAKVTGQSGNANEWYRDCVGVGLAGAWSAGEALTLKPTIQSMAYSLAGTPSGWGGNATDLKVIGASTLCVTASTNGTDYTTYPSSLSFNFAYEAEDIAGACTNRARITLGDFSGEASLTVPRNSDLFNIVETNGDIAGTLAIRLRPSGTYDTGSQGTYTSNLYMYGKYLRNDNPAGPSGDITADLEFHVQDVSWTTYSDLGSAAI
jgi:hypothetical protein